MSLIGWLGCAFKLGLEMSVILWNGNVRCVKPILLVSGFLTSLALFPRSLLRSPGQSLAEQRAGFHSFPELSCSPWTIERASMTSWPLRGTEAFKFFFSGRIGANHFCSGLQWMTWCLEGLFNHENETYHEDSAFLQKTYSIPTKQ